MVRIMALTDETFIDLPASLRMLRESIVIASAWTTLANRAAKGGASAAGP